uniref:YjgP/YjgQ family permease n=1 Tax=Gronococcus sybilensis TaxID=3028029 RepID=A0A9Y1MX63_9RHOD|nr:hypothetical protein GRSY_080 [Gronococcus sybilensis]
MSTFRLLDVYLFKELFIPFLLGICLFSFLGFFLGTLFELTKEIVAGLPLHLVWQICIFKLPFFISIAMPMSSLFSGLIAYSRLSMNNEFLALRSCGISVHRWLRANFCFGFIVGILCLVLNELIVPLGNYSVQHLYSEHLLSEQNHNSLSHVTSMGDKSKETFSQFLYARCFKNNNIKDLVLIDFDKQKLKSILIAESLTFNSSVNTWTLDNGQIYTTSKTISLDPLIKFKSQQLCNIEALKPITQVKYSPSWMNIISGKAYKEIVQISNNLTEMRKVQVRIAQKYSAPVTCLTLNIIGALIGGSSYNTKASKGFGLCLLIIFLYYITSSISESLGIIGIAPPWLAGWSPELICIFSTIVALSKMK